MRDILIRAKAADLQSVHTALAEEFLAPGRRRDFLFSPTPLPGGAFGAWVRVNDESETRGREVVVPPVGGEADFLLRAFAARKWNGKKRALPALPKFDPDRMEWLQRRAAAAGFAVLRASFTLENAEVRRRAGAFGFNVTVFAGRLRVADADKFESALREGVGTRRGYGCGMLMLMPDARPNSHPSHPAHPVQSPHPTVVVDDKRSES